ncbi:MAG: cofactor-independent phosphoglycerate mutase [Rikenellaceae bacterium]
MKYIIVLGDGMAGHPIEELGGRTTLQAAAKPAIDALAAAGRCGMLNTVPEPYEPGSEIANLAVLGYDIPKVFEGRGALEAASMGIEIEEGEMAMRCNLITVTEDGAIKNHSAGHISTEEATELIEYLERELGDDVVSLHAGVSYRHLLKIKGGNKYLSCTPPHNVPGTPFRDVMVGEYETASEEQRAGAEGRMSAAQTAKLLNDITLRSQELLAAHPINLKRVSEGKDPANSIWAWSPGYKPAMEPLTATYDIESGSVISAVDLIKGIGVYAGLTPIEVEGATGLYDTNYEAKAEAAIEALRSEDFVYLHIEASDEAGHEGDYELKIRTIEYLSERAVRPIVEAVKGFEEPVRIAILPDHPTPCKLRTHVREAVPFVIYDPAWEGDSVERYDEESCREGSFGEISGAEFIELLLTPTKG